MYDLNPLSGAQWLIPRWTSTLRKSSLYLGDITFDMANTPNK